MAHVWLHSGPFGDFRGPTGHHQGMPMMERQDMRALKYHSGYSEHLCRHNEGTQQCISRVSICCVSCRVDHGLDRSRSVYCDLHSIMIFENCLQGLLCVRCVLPTRHNCVTGHCISSSSRDRWKQTSDLSHCMKNALDMSLKSSFRNGGVNSFTRTGRSSVLYQGC